MKKLDKLILRAFLGPLALTLFVVVFILLTQLMLNKMDEFVGKDLGFIVLSELMFYFSINLTQTALPLAVLLSSLMTYGNLGEFSELTAIKGAGISLVRALRPTFILVVIITVLAFFNNNYVVTKANLKAYSLLYDIKKHKPSLDIKEGAFYNGIPDYSIKINKKYDDGETLGDIIIYDHSGKQGNNIVTFADSGRMYSVLQDRYLMFELYNGKRYEEIPKAGGPRRGKITDFVRNDFKHSKLVLSLASFDFQKSKEELWQNHYYMKRISQLKDDVDSMDLVTTDARIGVYDDAARFFARQFRDRVQMPAHYVERKAYSDSVRTAMMKEDSLDYRQQYNQSADSLVERQLITPQIEREVTVPNQQSAADQPSAPDESAVQQLSQLQQRGASATATTDNPTVPDEYAAQQLAQLQQDSASNNSTANNTTDPPTAPNDYAAWQLSQLKQRAATPTVTTAKPTVPSGYTAEQQEEIKQSTTATITKLNKLPNVSRVDSTKNVELPNLDSLFQTKRNKSQGVRQALSETRNIKNKINVQVSRLRNQKLMITKYEIEVNKKYAQAFACLVMFLIGAPLGSIIKKGGLGVPVIISIVFFILYYVLSITGKKWAEEDVVTPFVGIWGFTVVLLPIGIFFLRQARNDARLLESDFYAVIIEKIKSRFSKKNQDENS